MVLADSSARPRVATYDGLRAAAAAAVVAVHAWPQLIRGGRLGVDVFFVLSGWLITNLLVNELSATGRVALGHFYWRRAKRLFPPLVIAVALAIVIAAAAWPASLVDTERQGAAALLYLGNWAVLDGWVHSGLLSHTWTLGIEEQFYAVWPLLLLFALRFRGRGTACAIAASLAALGLAHGVLVGGTWVAESRGSGLLIGSALALAPARWWLRWPGTWRVVTLIAAGCLAILLVAPSDPVWPLAVVASALIIPTLGHDHTSPVSRALAWSPLVWLGRRSYALYLLNLPLTALLLPSLGYGPVLLVTAATLSVLGAAASWRYVEAPLAAGLRGRNATSISMRASNGRTEDPCRGSLAASIYINGQMQGEGPSPAQLHVAS
ncbi:MAG: acyltransferase family protein [Candidatus Dormibacteria bacterium]